MNIKTRERITRAIDFFYRPPISSIVPIETFRYGVVGGANLGFGLVFYWFLFHFILHKQDTSIFGLVTISAPIMAFLINFVVTFFTGFYLTRNIAFGGRSILRGREQIFRYAQVVGLNIAVNYLVLKLLVDTWDLYPTPSFLVAQIITTSLSYLASKYYTFK